MNVYFKNSRGNEILIDTVDNEKQAMKSINNFCRERGFKIYYTRSWQDGDNKDRTILDVGSHSEFFIIDRGK